MRRSLKQVICDYREYRFRKWCLRMYLRARGNHYGAKMPAIYDYVKWGTTRKERRYRKKCIKIAAGIPYGSVMRRDCVSTLMEFVDFIYDYFRLNCDPRDL